ncbi:MAG: DEAD/DEAH box helicase family protein, partial [Desulfovibrio sp.]|nr:DEAD/DEAH box helicase family protein [Desulfovibrio sp.]
GWLLNLGTGGGKTILACRMLQELGRTALVLVPRQHLVKQWMERILEFTTLQQADIGIAQQNLCEYKGKKIVVGMVHSLSKDKYTEDFKNHFGVVVFDECHVTGAQTFSETLGMFPAKYRIGLSATMERKDNLQDAYKLSIGQVLLAPEKITTLVQPKVFLRAYKAAKRHPYLSNMKDAKARRGKLISELSSDLARNALIGVYAKKFADSGRRVVVFSDRVEQLKLLRDILTKRHGMSLAAIGLFTGSTKAGDRKVILEHSQIILATYGVMAMGIDVPDLRAVIFATPLSDVAQSVGRILRLCEGTKDPVVLDIVDTAYADCTRWAYMRQKYYNDTAKAKLYEVK